MQRLLNTLSTELFASDSPETRGERLFVRLVEGFLLAYTLHFCWDWGFYIQRNITEVILPLGIAQYIDVSFLFDHYLAVGNAALVTALGLMGFFRLWRPSYAAALALFHLQYTARYSLGEISHGSNLVGMGILGLALAQGAQTFEWDRKNLADRDVPPGVRLSLGRPASLEDMAAGVETIREILEEGPVSSTTVI